MVSLRNPKLSYKISLYLKSAKINRLLDSKLNKTGFFCAQFQPIALNQNAEKSSFLTFKSSFFDFQIEFFYFQIEFFDFQIEFCFKKSSSCLKFSCFF